MTSDEISVTIIKRFLFSTSWHVVYCEVETTDPTTGHPLTLTLKALPEIYQIDQSVQAAADQLNAGEEGD